MQFDMPKEQSSIIKVLGVGGGGSNAVNHMYGQGIKGVDFVVCNTDQQALDISPVPTKIQIGADLTEGMGAGSEPEVGRNAAVEDIDQLKSILEKNTKMVFVTAGMGGGTGSGAAPVIAQTAREMDLLTVGIVTLPFSFEGKQRREQAEKGIEAMRDNVDSLLVICNDRLREMYGDLNLSNAFAQADDVLSTAAKGIAEVITVTGKINVDFKDVNTVMRDSGVAILGSSIAEGEERAKQGVEKALSSPLLNDNDISGASHVLLNITYGEKEVTMDEISDITDHIQDEAGSTANVIWGHGYDETLGEALSVTIIATGFKSSPDTGSEMEKREKQKKKYLHLNEKEETPPTQEEENPAMASSQITSTEEKTEPAEPEGSRTEATQETPENPEEANDPDSPYLKTKEDQTGASGQEDQSEAPSENSGPEKVEWHQEAQRKEYGPERRTEKDPGTGTPAEEPRPFHANTSRDQGEIDPEQQRKRSTERIDRIQELGMKLRSPSGIEGLEEEPAYVRRNIKLDEEPHSSTSNASRYTLSEEEDEDGKKKTTIRENNPYLHDKPD